MLSTSNKNKFQYQYLLIAVLIFAIVSVIALYQTGVLPKVSIGQSDTQSLTTLSPIEASTYRWEAMADFYAKQAAAGLDYSIINQPVAVENSLTQYYLSERGTFAAFQNGMDIYHQSERNAAWASANH